MPRAGNDELIILAPPEPDVVYTNFIRSFLDYGCCFPFGQDYALPNRLPDSLDGVWCVVAHPALRDTLESGPTGERLNALRARGGMVYYVNLNLPAGGAMGDGVVRHYAQRVITTAGLTTHHPSMLNRLQAMPDGDIVQRGLEAVPQELAQYATMGNPFGDPVGCVTFPAAAEAADYFAKQELLDPVWAFVGEQHPRVAAQHELTGVSWILQYAERTGRDDIVQAVLANFRTRRQWWLDGVLLNRDLHAPPGVDVTDPPARVRETAWTWPENACRLAESFPALARVTGDPAWTDRAVTHVQKSHAWLFDRQVMLWRHVGRPDGPDLRSACWGRGNAWFLFALRALLDALPEAHPKRDALVTMLRDALEGILRTQDEHGLWGNVLDAAPADTRPCASATWRFLAVYARAYARGWLTDERIPAMVERAWLGLKTKIWDGLLAAYCVGTSYGLDRQVYLARPHDRFRTSRSALLLAWIELQRLRATSA